MNGITHLVIDPPWEQRQGGHRKARPRQQGVFVYEAAPLSDIERLLDNEILPLAAPTHNVFLWTINKYLWEGEQMFFQRGYRLHTRLVWNKLNGIAPAFTVRFAHEYCLWLYKPRLLPVASNQRGKFLSVITEKAREHSRKPDALYAMIDDLYPDGERMDVFSREKRNGWLQWGNQCDFFTERVTA